MQNIPMYVCALLHICRYAARRKRTKWKVCSGSKTGLLQTQKIDKTSELNFLKPPFKVAGVVDLYCIIPDSQNESLRKGSFNRGGQFKGRVVNGYVCYPGNKNKTDTNITLLLLYACTYTHSLRSSHPAAIVGPQL